MVERIAELCRQHDMSMTMLEKELGLSNGSITKWRRSVPYSDRLYKVARYFGVTMEFLLTGEDT